jgi:succinate-semialdehyde dehydrogenase/glutarate-semialdehyde dehydrogenase
LVVGDGLTNGVDQGPLITESAANRVENLVSEAARFGGKVACGGNRLPLGPNFFAPTILMDIPASARVLREEIFGPVISLVPFQREPDVVAAANDTMARLAAYVYTSNLDRAWRMIDALDFGVVGVNDPRPVTAEAPFGGSGDSGLGREGGVEGLLDFAEPKLVGIRFGSANA